eukprot:SAG31_NODE_499_length_14841_cov_7.930471_6_plen_167_part_00
MDRVVVSPHLSSSSSPHLSACGRIASRASYAHCAVVGLRVSRGEKVGSCLRFSSGNFLMRPAPLPTISTNPVPMCASHSTSAATHCAFQVCCPSGVVRCSLRSRLSSRKRASAPQTSSSVLCAAMFRRIRATPRSCVDRSTTYSLIFSNPPTFYNNVQQSAFASIG